MQIGEHLDQRVDAGLDGGFVAEGLEFGRVTDHPAGDVLDHLERRAQHSVVVTHGHRARHGHGRVLQRGDHLVLAGHIVRRRRQAV
ncbi:hypothetical protein A5698_03160 [Mycobacterium sp. E136]|nr:hypothetical protein A5698_03160 [Mycobacterium sp. E136]